MNYITGEKIQEIADLFIATPSMLNFNPSITEKHSKAFNMNILSCCKIGAFIVPLSNKHSNT